jgi:hypothetical protein
MRPASGWIDVGIRSLSLPLGALTVGLAASRAAGGLDVSGLNAWAERVVSPTLLAVLGALAFAAAFFWIFRRSDSAAGRPQGRPEPALVPGAAARPDDAAAPPVVDASVTPPVPGRHAMFNLAFNVLVLIALVYLVAGGQPSREIRDGAVQAVEAARTLVPLPRQAADAPVSEPVPVKGPAAEAPRPMPKPPTPPATPEAASDKPVVPAPAPVVTPPELPSAQEVAERAARPPVTVAATRPDAPIDPAVARRRAEVLADGPVPPATRQASKPAFMTPAERVRELQRLAEEMEIVFTDRLAR